MKRLIFRFIWDDIAFECSLNHANFQENCFLKELDRNNLICQINSIISQIFSTARLAEVGDHIFPEFDQSFICQINQYTLQVYVDETHFDIIKNKFLLSTAISLECYRKASSKRLIVIGNRTCVLLLNNKYFSSECPISLVSVNLELNKNDLTLYISHDSLQKLVVLFGHKLNIPLNTNNALQVELGLNIFIYYLHLVGFQVMLLNWQVKRIKADRMLKLDISCDEEVSWFLLFDHFEQDTFINLYEQVGNLDQVVQNLPILEIFLKLPYKVVTMINNYSLETINRLNVGDILLSNQLSGREDYYIDLGKTLLGIRTDYLESIKVIKKVTKQ